MSTDTPVRHTPEDLFERSDWKDYELVDGQLVELNISTDSSWIAGRICRRIGVAEDRNLGWVFPEGTAFRCFSADPDRIRKPDVSFIVRERLLSGVPNSTALEIAPDLVVEVISRHDAAWQVSEKVHEWLDCGVAVVWVVMSPEQSVTIYESGKNPIVLMAKDVITLEMIPDFKCQVSEFFPTCSNVESE